MLDKKDILEYEIANSTIILLLGFKIFDSFTVSYILKKVDIKYKRYLDQMKYKKENNGKA